MDVLDTPINAFLEMIFLQAGKLICNKKNAFQ